MSEGFFAVTFEPFNLQPGKKIILVTKPEISLQAPYYLGIHVHPEDLVFVQRLQFANCTPLGGRGSYRVNSVLFCKEIGKSHEWPKGLMPIDGPNLSPRNTIMLEVINPHEQQIEVCAIVWGTPRHENLSV